MLTLKKTLNNYKDVVLLGLVAVVVGVVVGAIDTVFGMGLLAVTNIRNSHFVQLVPFLPLAGILIAFAYSKFGKSSIKGMALIFSVGFGEEEKIPKRLIPLIMISTWLTNLFGGSAGREGAAVQIGGTAAHTIGNKLNIKNSSKIILIAGMAAGFAGLFQTPIAAIFFAMEVFTAGLLEYGALFPCIVAAFVASFTSHILGLKKFSVNLNCTLKLNAPFVFKIILLGILFGIVGGIFAYSLNWSKDFFGKRMQNPILRVFILGCILSIWLFLLHKGRYAGSGTNLIEASFFHGRIYGYDWLLKFILTILTLSAGYQGGEMTPLFSIGACFGTFLASLIGLPAEFAAALGYAALFGSATNTLISPIFIGAEVFGFDYMPYFFVVSVIAYIFNGNKSIYPAQKIHPALR
ncbi:MAG: Voltage-gated chloride channel protein [Lachnoclostridium sp.]|jgi:H+/Cl- antiporter ClcA